MLYNNKNIPEKTRKLLLEQEEEEEEEEQKMIEG